MAAATLAFDILARDRASRTFKTVGDNADRAHGRIDRFGAGLGGLAKSAGLAAVGVGGLAVVVGKGFVDAAIESQKVTKQTDAVIKSMGGSAKVTAEQVEDLSQKLSLQTGVDDELIQSGQNVLLTFAQIRNEAGEGNKIFDRATEAVLNMSVALGKDMGSSAIQVGKALNDPIKGMTALGRAGVQFTQQQKNQIKTMVEAGDVLGAQKIIVGELEKQFGGSAEAQATAVDKLNVIWGNFSEEMGRALLPVVEKVAVWLADNLPAAMASVNTAVDKHWPAIRDGIVTAVETIRSIVEPIVLGIQVLWANFGDNILAFVRRVWAAIQQSISGALEVIRGVVQVVTSLIQGDWSGVWEGIKHIVHGAFNFIVGRIRQGFEVIRFVVGVALETVGSVFRGAWEGIIDFISSLPAKIASAASGMWDGIKEAFKAAINWIIEAWNGLEFKIPGFDPPGPGPKFGGFTLGVPDIPTLHTGTDFFRPPGGAREGLALLERGERVTPAGDDGGGIHLHVTQLPGENQVDAGMRALRHHRQIRLVMQGAG